MFEENEGGWHSKTPQQLKHTNNLMFGDNQGGGIQPLVGIV